MKSLPLVFLSMSLLAISASAAVNDGASSPEELASKVKDGIAEKDSKAIASLYYWEGVTPDIARQLEGAIEAMLDEPVRTAEVGPVPGDFQAVQELGAKRYRQNLKVEGMITLIYSPTDDSATATMPYGARNGRYYFTAPVAAP